MHALNDRQITGAGRSDFVLDFVDGFCVTLEKMRRSGGVDGCRIRHQPAHIKAVDERKFFNVLADQLCQLQQNTLAVCGVGPRPKRLPRMLCARRYSAVHILKVTRRKIGQKRIRCGVDRLKSLTRGGIDDFVINEGLMVKW